MLVIPVPYGVGVLSQAGTTLFTTHAPALLYEEPRKSLAAGACAEDPQHYNATLLQSPALERLLPWRLTRVSLHLRSALRANGHLHAGLMDS